MLIYIRGLKVRTKLIAHSLNQTRIDTYKPSGWVSFYIEIIIGLIIFDFKKPHPVKITYGMNTENKNVYGMMLYHRNRLIKPFVRVGTQLSGKEGM
jgi:hypothetical protein